MMMSPLTLLRITITLFPMWQKTGSVRYTPATIFYLSRCLQKVNGNRPAFICMETVHTSPSAPMVMVFLGPPIATTIPLQNLQNRTRGQSNRSGRSGRSDIHKRIGRHSLPLSEQRNLYVSVMNRACKFYCSLNHRALRASRSDCACSSSGWAYTYNLWAACHLMTTDQGRHRSIARSNQSILNGLIQ